MDHSPRPSFRRESRGTAAACAATVVATIILVAATWVAIGHFAAAQSDAALGLAKGHAGLVTLVQGGVVVSALIVIAGALQLFHGLRQHRARWELLHQEERIRHQAYHDALTGLANRALLYDRLSQAIEVAARERDRLGILFIDLDNFKVVNDSLGHDKGDQLLRMASERLLAATRASDTVARLGGDEFVIVAATAGEAFRLVELGQRLVETLGQTFDLDGHPAQVHASIGVAIYPDDGEGPAILMKNADAAMYQAKAGGKNAVCFFREEINQKIMARLAIGDDLQRALADGRLVVHYQPKFNLRTGALDGAEALVRWVCPDRGLVLPGEFLAVAEESGLIERIGDWILDEVCRQLAEWRSSRLVPRVAVNVSARQFLRPGFTEGVQARLDRHRVPASLIGVELTEATVMADPDLTARHLGRLRDLGVEVSLDDFGTGRSSLTLLSRLPIDVLKIDRSFIAGGTEGGRDTAIVKAIVQLGKALGMTVIAGGVETSAELAMARSCGCPRVQGFLTGPPQPATLFATLLDDEGSGDRVRRIA